MALARGRIAYVDRSLHDRVQRSATATDDPGASRNGWRLNYFRNACPARLHAEILLLRCGEELKGDKRRAVKRMLKCRPVLAARGLAGRALGRRPASPLADHGPGAADRARHPLAPRPSLAGPRSPRGGADTDRRDPRRRQPSQSDSTPGGAARRSDSLRNAVAGIAKGARDPPASRVLELPQPVLGFTESPLKPGLLDGRHLECGLQPGHVFVHRLERFAQLSLIRLPRPRERRVA